MGRDVHYRQLSNHRRLHLSNILLLRFNHVIVRIGRKEGARGYVAGPRRIEEATGRIFRPGGVRECARRGGNLVTPTPATGSLPLMWPTRPEQENIPRPEFSR